MPGSAESIAFTASVSRVNGSVRSMRLKSFLTIGLSIREAQKLVGLAILMATTQSESYVADPDRHIATPVFDNVAVRFQAVRRKLRDEILGETFAPEPWIDLLFLAVIRRKLGRAKLEKGLHVRPAAELTERYVQRRFTNACKR
jgi:hypothetical protein